MATINLIWPVLPWTPLDEIIDGVLVKGARQFECANPNYPGLQLTLRDVGGKPALRLLVDSGSQYGDSTWLRALGRITSPSDKRFVDGSSVAVAKRVLIPAGQILDGATVIDEAHGPANDVAPVRLIVRPDGNLYASFNGGVKVGPGYTGWTKEQLVGAFTLGIEHELVYGITFSPDPARGHLWVMIDGKLVFERAGATAQIVGGVYQHPYLLSGIYVASASTPVVCLIRGIAVADTSAEAVAALDRILAEAAPEPDPVPDQPPAPAQVVTRAELDDAITALTRAFGDALAGAVAAERARAEAAEDALAVALGEERQRAEGVEDAISADLLLVERRVEHVRAACAGIAAKASATGKQVAAAIAKGWPT